MQGRVDKKIETEQKIINKINDYPEFLKRFYYSLNQKTHMTKLRYMENVIRFLEYYSTDNIKSLSINDLSNIDAYIIEQYMSDINYYNKDGSLKELSNSTKACIYSSINAFFTFLAANNYITDNPFNNKRIQRPKLDDTSITFLTPDEVKEIENRILKGYGSDKSVAKQMDWKYRDYLLFRIPVVTGLRVEALSEINIEDVNLVNKTIRVTEKGNITKDIYIDEKTVNYLLKWIMEREELLLGYDDCNALFISNQRTRIGVRGIEKIIEKYTNNINGKHITPHKLRSTCGTNLYQAKKDIYLVAEVLGHKSTEPTKRYTKIFDTDKRDAINTVASLYS